MPSGPLVRPARSAILAVALCQPCSASFMAFSVAFRASAIPGDVPLKLMLGSASLRGMIAVADSQSWDLQHSKLLVQQTRPLYLRGATNQV